MLHIILYKTSPATKLHLRIEISKPCKGSSAGLYEPSFVKANGSAIKNRKEIDSGNGNMFTFQSTIQDNPFSNFKSLDSSANSVKSATSVDSEKKAKLMKELFNYDAV